MKELKQSFKIKLIVITAAVLVLAAVIAVIFIWGTASVYFYTPSDEVQTYKVLKGRAVSLEPPAPIAGYTFIGWEDTQGNLETRESITLYEDTYYSAVYSVALNCEEHAPYMFPDEYGFFRPNSPMTRGDAAQMLYSLLSVKVKGDDNFMDVSPKAEYYKATAALKELGVVEGSRFHPDETITRRELLGMISAFFPHLPEIFAFADVDKTDPDYAIFCSAAAYGWIESGSKAMVEPDAEMTRLDVAVLMNRVLGRRAENSGQHEIAGFVLDVTPQDEYYYDVAEAVIDHEYSLNGDAEVWTTNAPVEKASRGFYLAGTELYFITNNGYVLKNSSIDGFRFDENGRYTSGMPELDELVQGVLSEIIDSSMEPLEMLKKAYCYTVDSFSYIKGYIYSPKDTSWANEEAYTMLTNKRGNCYCFAATFYQLARALGFDAQVYSGNIGSDRSPHGWVEIDIDGETYIFDPEMEMAYMENHGQKIDMFMMTYKEAAKWSYSR